MRTQIVLGALAALIALAVPANTAEVTADPGVQREFSAKMGMCELCHAVNGMPRTPNIPVLWGQQETYLLKQLRDFRSGDRGIEVMEWAAKTLHAEELGPTAAYFAKKTWPARAAAAAAPTPPPRGVAVCQACHQADFRGAPLAEGSAAPRLAGQSYDYLLEAMSGYAEGGRTNNAQMVEIMKAISPADRQAMARYISSL